MPTNDINIYELFKLGQAKLQALMTRQEVGKLGNLRAGNSGMIDPQGNIIGPCAALTYLRFIGLDIKGLEDDGDSGGAPGRELMFEGGRTNEDSWMAVLEKSWPDVILREEEIATRWQTTQGVNVTGRPDIVLCKTDTSGPKPQVNPVLGIELKQVSSFWTAYEVKFKGMPKFPHLLQAAHYSATLGIPFEIWYTSRTDYHMDSWIKKELPQPGQMDSEYLTYTYYRRNAANKSGKSKVSKLVWDKLPPSERLADPVKVMPFIQGFRIDIREGQLYYQDAMHPGAEWMRTVITKDGIKKYYDLIPDMTVVPPEPKVLKADGQLAGYKASDYCSLGDLCCAYKAGQDITSWTEEVQQLTTGSN